MKWSKPAIILVVVAVLLIAAGFTQKVYAEAMAQVSQSQSEISKTKSHLEEVKSEKVKLSEDVKSKDARIQQLEQENAELKG